LQNRKNSSIYGKKTGKIFGLHKSENHEKAGTERGKASEKIQNERKENLQDFCYNAGNSSGRRESRSKNRR